MLERMQVTRARVYAGLGAATLGAAALSYLAVVDPHRPGDGSPNRKPGIGMVLHYLRDRAIDLAASAMVGDRAENANRPQGAQEQEVRQCRNVDAYESRTNGYDVTYEYRGQTYTTLMNRDPGNRVRLRVSVQPVDAAH